jgi:hypothetical protein
MWRSGVQIPSQARPQSKSLDILAGTLRPKCFPKIHPINPVRILSHTQFGHLILDDEKDLVARLRVEVVLGLVLRYLSITLKGSAKNEC